MGGCVSSCRSNGGLVSSSCYRMGMCRPKKSKKTFADHVTSVQHLSSIPNRICSNGKSRGSCIYTQQGRKGVNQDAMIVWEDFMADEMTFCGVFDGHGPHGHLVARKVRDALPLKMSTYLNQIKQVGEAENDSSSEEKINELWKEAFLKSYKAMDKELKSHPNLDCFCSGSTAVTIVKQGSNLYMGNIGDSRAIMGSRDADDSLIAIQLTVDLKPDLPTEAERIKRCKGRVFSLQDEPEVHRVWLPFDDAPGLAMARAFGDFCLKEYGVISVPEFAHRILTDKDQFIVLASDGVWDVLSNEEVVETVSSAPSRSSAARRLVESAAREWKLKYPTSKMDDCAVVCLFLDNTKMDSESDCDDDPGFSSATIQSNHSGGAMESEDGPNTEPSLQRNVTVRATGQGLASGDQNWRGLEGVTRVNSLVQLPRFSAEMPSS